LKIADAGRASRALTPANTDGSHGSARNSGRETSSMASINIDSHNFSPFPNRHG
jgi:hypothetical protein